MENLVINIGNPRRVELTVLSANGVKVELSRCTDVQLILWINGRSKRALSTQISNDVLIADLSASELSYLGEYSGQVKYTDSGVQQTTERVYLFRVANEFFKSTSGTGVSDTGSLVVSVSTPIIAYDQKLVADAEKATADANAAKDLANTAATNANDKANLANTAARNADIAKANAEKATADANTATLNASNAATNANDKAAYAKEQGDYAKQQGLNAVSTAGEAATNADNAAFAASQQAAYAKQQGDYAKQEAQGIDAKIATKADQSDLVQLEQNVRQTSGIVGYKTGFFVHKLDGSEVANPDFKVSDYFKLIKGNDVQVIGRQQFDAAYCCFYDTNKRFIGSYPVSSELNNTNINKIIKWSEIEASFPNALYIRSSASINYTAANIAIPDITVQKSYQAAYESVDKLEYSLKTPTKFIEGYYRHVSTGELVSLDGFKASEMYLLTRGSDLQIINGKHQVNAAFCCFYDSNQNFVGSYSLSSTRIESRVISWSEIEGISSAAVYASITADISSTASIFSLGSNTEENQSFSSQLGEIKRDINKISTLSASDVYLCNNLINQSNNLSLINGNYGSAGAIYEIPVSSNNCRVAFDFTIDESLNESVNRKTIAEIQIGSEKLDIKTISALSEQLFRKFALDPRQNNALLQHEKFNSGFEIIGNDNIRDSLFYEPIIGNAIFSIWLKGAHKNIADFTGANSTSGDNYLSDRDRWLSENRDYAIVIENDTFSIIRDGVDVGIDKLPFNNGVTSVIFSTSLKDTQGNYKTLKALYEDIKSENSAGKKLADFYINHYDVSYRATCAEISQFGKIKLVGKYFQQIANIEGGYNADHGDHYDSFPFLVRMKKDTKKHTCEIVLINNKLYVQVDGVMFQKSINAASKIDKIILGGKSNGTLGNVTCSDLEVWIGNIGDAEVSNITIATKRSPYSVGLMGHYIIDAIEGNAFDTGYLGQSLSRMEDVCKLLREREYEVLGLDEINKMVNNYTVSSGKNAFIVFDDQRVGELYENKRIRQSITKYGLPVILADIMKGEYENNPDKYFKLFTSMRNNDWYNMSHSYYHNISYCEKNSIVLFAEVNKMIEVADTLNMFNHSITYPFAAGWEVTHNIFNMLGYSFAILNNGPNYSIKARNKYMLARINMADDASFETLKTYLF